MHVHHNELHHSTQFTTPQARHHVGAQAATKKTAKPDLHVAGHKKFGLTQGLETTTLRLAVPTLPALSTAEYVTM